MTQNERDLGVIISENGKFQRQVNSAVAKAKCMIAQREISALERVQRRATKIPRVNKKYEQRCSNFDIGSLESWLKSDIIP
jgi:hypothetical protein